MDKGNKLHQFLFFQKDEHMAGRMPYTVQLTEESFNAMLNYYATAIIKPAVSQGGGKEVYKVADHSSKVEVYHRDQKRIFHNRQDAYAYLQSVLDWRLKPYIIQELVDLVRIGGKPLDIRMVVQRKLDSEKWQVTGSYAKMAKEGYFITNLKHNRAGLLTLEEAFTSLGLPDRKKAELVKEMEQVCLTVAEKLHPLFPEKTIWGLDLGINQYLQVKIIEINSNPGDVPFHDLKNPAMLKKINAIRKYNRKLRRG
ncbi:YheC/YheD family protein [Bacillus sp. B-jedd]|uniref:YheC/YheD family protein n=1 Tax=Bacillus sp. B-jedd TaxID=1476857 RepID=UPI001E3F8E3A|nr:YheC/YheD family protein [Bacillus sp. B-jedd]